MVKLLTAFLATSYILTSYGQDLRATNPAVMNRLHIQNQGSEGLCYAYSSSFIIDYHRFNSDKTATARTHPYSIGILYAKFANIHAALNGGDVCKSVLSSVKEKKIKSSLTSGTNSDYDKLGLMFHRVMATKIATQYAPLNPDKKFPTMSIDQLKGLKTKNKDQEILFKNFKTVYQDVKEKMTYQYFIPANYQPSTIEAFLVLQGTYLANSWGSISPMFISLILSRSSQIQINIPALTCHDIRQKKKIPELIRNEIISNRPVGITYCSNILIDPTFKSTDENGGYISQKLKGECKNHASAIIGIKKINEKEYYLIRNSWGKTYSHSPKWKMDNGDLWILKESLTNNLFSIQLIKKSGT